MSGKNDMKINKRINFIDYNTYINAIIALITSIYIYKLFDISIEEITPFLFIGLWYFVAKMIFDVKIEKDKLVIFVTAILAIYISFIAYIGKIAWHNVDMHFLSFDQFIIACCGVPFIYLLLLYVGERLARINLIFTNESNNNLKYIWPVCSFLLFVAWLPAFISNYPGIIISDYVWQYNQAIGNNTLSNHHPVIHTMVIRLCQWMSKVIFNTYKPDYAVALNSIVQMLILSIIIGYIIIQYLSKKQSNTYWLCVGLFIYYAFFPMNAIYSVYMTKDVLFSAVLVLWSELIYNYLSNKHEYQKCRDLKAVLVLSLFSVLIIYLRGNGFLIVLTSLIICIIFNKEKLVLCFLLIISCIALIIQQPLLNILKADRTEFVESIGMPINQVAKVVLCENDLETDKIEMIQAVMPIEKIKESYNKRYSDHLKFNAAFNGSVIERDKKAFLKLWIKMFFRYPRDYIEAWLDLTIGYWYPGVEKGCISYDYNNRNVFYDQLNITNYSTSEMYRHFMSEDVRNSPIEAWLWSPGLAVLALLLLCYLCVIKKQFRKLYFFIPAIIGWISLLIATPSYCETRYIFWGFLMIPVGIVKVFSLKKSYTEGKNG